MNNLATIIIFICALLLFGLVAALILSKSFRSDVLGGEGEASILGMLSVKGVSIVLLCALFIGGLLYPLKFATDAQLGKGNTTRDNSSNVEKPPEEDVNKKLIADVYYFPSRESDALKIKIALEKKGFIVNVSRVGPDLKSAENLPSYILYVNFNLMLILKPIVEDLLNQNFNVSQVDKSNFQRPDNYVIFVLTSRSNTP